MKRFIACVLLSSLLCAPSFAAEEEVDYVALAALLMRDGETARAAEALSNVDTSAEGVDLIQYHTVRGLIALEQQALQVAAEAFDAAITAGQTDPLIHLYRAQALFGLERYADAVAALDAAGNAVDGLSGAWLLRAHARWMLGDKQAALDSLSEAGNRFPATPVSNVVRCSI